MTASSVAALAPAAPRLVLPALAGFAGTPLDQAALSDQARLALVLQAAALLAHLEHAGLCFAGGFGDLRVDGAGLLRARTVEAGRARVPPQLALRAFVERLFRPRGAARAVVGRGVSGRGEARRAARWLVERWTPAIEALPADLAVGEVLEAAPFLWEPAFAAARRTLVAELAGEDGRRRAWVAGPGPARRRLLAAGGTFDGVVAAVCGASARETWEGASADDDPRAHAAAGRHGRAVAAFRVRVLAGRDAVDLGRSLVALGRYGLALDALEGRSGVEERVLRLGCQVFLGELGAAVVTLRSLVGVELPAATTVEVADLAVRLEAQRGRLDEVRGWAERAVAAAPRQPLASRARVVAALAAWDCGDLTAMETHLEASRAALTDPDVGWRWRQAAALRCLTAADGAGAVVHLEAGLAGRRCRTRPEAARLWSDLACARVLADDLAGAERACRHTVRLLAGCDGPRRTTLALANLAEVRLRRGRTAGLEEILERSTAENRRAGNRRGLIRDLALWTRLELAQGRAVAALARCAEARQEIEESGDKSQAGVFEVFAARAHGWLGRPEAAAACLERVRPEDVGELEPEERPGLWVLAGAREQGAKEAADGRFRDLWGPLAAGVQPRPEAWEVLGSLEPYRAARLALDAELAVPGAVPPARLRRAIAELRRVGAEPLAERLEGRSAGPWRALDRYLERPSGDAEAVAELLAGAGYRDALLVRRRRGVEEVLAPGAGGPETLAGELDGGGQLEIRAPAVDPALRTLFALVRRDLRRPVTARPEREREAPSGAEDGMIGASPALAAALERLDRLAAGELPVLVLGESGCGKELMARRVHRKSKRASGPYLVVNCAALSETLILSDLFGHVRGAFTGAERDHPGVFESARGGTLFLDEIGDLPPTAQGKLLRVLQEGEIRRVGESFPRNVDVRVIAATHRDLERMVAAGEFRQDLFFRLKVATVRLPPLRERGGDVLLLAEHFLARQAADSGVFRRLSPAARARIVAHPWPGNVRELENVLEVAAALADDEILPAHLDLPVVRTEERGGDYHHQVEALRKRLVSDALADAGGNRAEAARRLGLTRQALSYLVRQLGLDGPVRRTIV